MLRLFVSPYRDGLGHGTSVRRFVLRGQPRTATLVPRSLRAVPVRGGRPGRAAPPRSAARRGPAPQPTSPTRQAPGPDPHPTAPHRTVPAVRTAPGSARGAWPRRRPVQNLLRPGPPGRAAPPPARWPAATPRSAHPAARTPGSRHHRARRDTGSAKPSSASANAAYAVFDTHGRVIRWWSRAPGFSGSTPPGSPGCRRPKEGRCSGSRPRSACSAAGRSAGRGRGWS
jgi:hypothetical protein